MGGQCPPHIWFLKVEAIEVDTHKEKRTCKIPGLNSIEPNTDPQFSEGMLYQKYPLLACCSSL